MNRIDDEEHQGRCSGWCNLSPDVCHMALEEQDDRGYKDLLEVVNPRGNIKDLPPTHMGHYYTQVFPS